MSAPALKFKPIALAVAFAFPTFAFAAAGRIDFAVGDVKALAADGRTRPLAKGDEFDSGDTIETGTGGRVWLRFTDGAQVSLQPQSQYRIDNYRFNGQADGEERGFFNLVKGGLRTITGWVGRTNRKNYQVTTAVATIGIRGTEFSIVYGNSITVTTGEGAVEVCNSAGCLTLSSGESGYVADQETKPVLVTAKADLPPTPPLPDPTFSVANDTNSSGGAAIIGSAGMVSGPGYRLFGIYDPGSSLPGFPSGTATFTNNALTDFTASANQSATNTGTAQGFGDGIIGWGHWTSGSFVNFSVPQPASDLHYVTGVPSINVVTGTLSLLGATVPSSSGPAIGTVTGGSLTFDGATSEMTFSLAYSTGYTVSSWFPATVTGGTFSGETQCAGGANCGATGSFSGLFAGTNGARAGLTYYIPFGAGTVWGAAAFTR